MKHESKALADASAGSIARFSGCAHNVMMDEDLAALTERHQAPQRAGEAQRAAIPA
jgi:hypothetical protein